MTGLELGPWLGVVSGVRARATVGGLDLDPIRRALVNRLLEHARRPQPDWLGAWTPVTAEASHAVLERLAGLGAQAALESRAPKRLTRLATPDDDDIRLVNGRIESTGIPLEEAVAALDPVAPVSAQLPAIGTAVEEAWLDLERVVGEILAEWTPRVEVVRGWRRPTPPLWAVTAVAGLLAVGCGGMIGGYLPAPDWFEPVIAWWWALPWP